MSESRCSAPSLREVALRERLARWLKWLDSVKPFTVCLVLASAVLAVLAGSRTARAQPPAQRRFYAEPPLASEPVITVEHYGYQIAIADALAVAATPITGGAAGSLYFLGGPIIHFAHGQVGMGFLSLGLRIGLPVLGFAAASSAVGGCGSNGGLCESKAVLLTASLGAAAAMVLDWTLLARKTVITQPGLFQVGNVRANPNLGVTRGGVSLGLSGSF